VPADWSIRRTDSVNHPLWWIGANPGAVLAQGIRQMAAIERPYGWISALTGGKASRGTTYTTVWSVRSHGFRVEVLVTGTAVTPGIGGRLRRVALRLLAGVGLAVLAWLLSAMVNSGTASAAENVPHTRGITDSAQTSDSGTDSNSGGGLLGSLLGGLGNALSGTVSNVTGTASAVASTATDVVGGVTGTLGTTVATVTAPVTTAVVSTVVGSSGGGSASGGTTASAPVPAKHVDQHAVAATVPVASAVVPPASPVAPTRQVASRPATSVVPQAVPAPQLPHVHVPPRRPLPAPPTPTPAVPVSFASPGHGFHGPARHVFGAYATHLPAPSLAASGVRSPDSATYAGRHQGLPPTTPD